MNSPETQFEAAQTGQEGFVRFQTIAYQGAALALSAVLVASAVHFKRKPVADVPQCAAPTSAALSATARLFDDRPKHPKYSEFDKGNPTDGLTFHDPYEAGITHLLLTTKTDTVAGFKKYLNTANSFTSLYGVTISLGEKDEETSKGWRIPTDGELTALNTSSTVSNIVSGISKMPVEYVRETGLKRVVLRYNTSENTASGMHTAGYVAVTGRHADDTIYENVAKSEPAETITHEASHLLDRKLCRPASVLQDKTISDINGSDIYGDKTQGPKLAITGKHTDPSIGTEVSSLTKELYIKSKSMYCRLLERVRSKLSKTYVADEYGFTNISEDKAKIADTITDPDQLSILANPDVPKINSKVHVILARIYQRLPNYVRYLAGITPKYPQISNYDCEKASQTSRRVRPEGLCSP
jgi:hypothetical protein